MIFLVEKWSRSYVILCNKELTFDHKYKQDVCETLMPPLLWRPLRRKRIETENNWN